MTGICYTAAALQIVQAELNTQNLSSVQLASAITKTTWLWVGLNSHSIP